MTDLLTRVIDNVLGRLVGPLTFRLVLQPAMAVIAGVKAGLNDARLQRPAYFWAMVTDRGHRRSLLRDGWKDVARIFTLAAAVDVVYQIIALRWVYPGEAILVALLLAVVPYLLVRGPVNRVVQAVGFKHGKEA